MHFFSLGNYLKKLCLFLLDSRRNITDTVKALLDGSILNFRHRCGVSGVAAIEL